MGLGTEKEAKDERGNATKEEKLKTEKAESNEAADLVFMTQWALEGLALQPVQLTTRLLRCRELEVQAYRVPLPLAQELNRLREAGQGSKLKSRV